MNTPFPIGVVPWFRVMPEDEVPGFHVTPQDVVPGFNLDPGVRRQDANWSAGMRVGSAPRDAEFPQTPASQMVLSPTPGSGTFLPSSPSVWPDWLNRLLTMPLPTVLTALDPRTGQRIVPYAPLINRTSFNPTEVQDVPEPQDVEADIDFPEVTLPPDSEPVETKPTEERPPLDTAHIDAPTGAALPQRVNVPPAATQTIWNPWFPSPSGREPYRQVGSGQFQLPRPPELAPKATPIPPAQWFRPAAGSSLVLPVAGSTWPRRSLPRSQPTQQNMTPIAPETRLTTGLPAAPMLQTPRATLGDLEPRRQREFAPPATSYPSSGDAETLPNGSIISGVYPYGHIGNAPITRLDPAGIVQQYEQGTTNSTGGIAPWDSNIHRVGDGDAPSDLSRIARHRLGVRHSIEIHLSRGFELVTDKELAVDVPGLLSPRFYDYIIRDPITRLCYGVEVKTTLGETIRLDRSQVGKDAIVATQGGTVPSTGLKLRGVSYMTHCFGCEMVDVRSKRLQQILLGSRVEIRKGSLPGEVRR